ncbi:MAG: hypothetical protein JXX28_00100 [Deltaproteobacteria bacterium]|nr:hypothetical protein [Deltaproteobacteria bacterium]
MWRHSLLVVLLACRHPAAPVRYDLVAAGELGTARRGALDGGTAALVLQAAVARERGERELAERAWAAARERAPSDPWIAEQLAAAPVEETVLAEGLALSAAAPEQVLAWALPRLPRGGVTLAAIALDAARRSCRAGPVWAWARSEPLVYSGDPAWAQVGLEAARLAGDDALALRLLGPEEGPTWVARALLDRGDASGALAVLERGGLSEDERSLAGEALLAGGHLDQALVLWDGPAGARAAVDALLAAGALGAARERAGGDPRLLARVLLAEGDRPGALALLPDPALRAGALWAAGDGDGALAALGELPPDAPRVVRDRARVLEGMGRLEAAEAAWGEAARRDPADATAALRLARLSGAAEDRARALAADPCSVEALLLAARYSADGAQARAYLERALEVAPLNPEALLALAERLGEQDERAHVLAARARRRTR